MIAVLYVRGAQGLKRDKQDYNGTIDERALDGDDDQYLNRHIITASEVNFDIRN